MTLSGGVAQQISKRGLLSSYMALQAQGFSIVFRKGNKAYLMQGVNNLRGKGGSAHVLTLFQSGRSFKMKFA
jgi:hypothetical protein